MFQTTQISYSENDTRKIAGKFSKLIKKSDVIIMNGELGSGKTFFIIQVLRELKITGVSSPTFSLVNEYPGKVNVYHFDFFRINKSEELIEIGINDYYNNAESIIFIEWGSLFPELLPKKRIEIEIKVKGENVREFIFERIDEK